MTLQPSMAAVVRRGLTQTPKSLPAYLFYDAAGSELFEKITELPEYYLTRSEHEIFEEDGDGIVAEAGRLLGSPFTVLELGAGTARKTQTLLRCLRRAHGRVRFVPADVSREPLDLAQARIHAEEPDVETRPLVATHAEALDRAPGCEQPLLVLFIGSSIGNYTDDEAVELLRQVRTAIEKNGGALLLGTDLRKSLDVLLPAYDDAAGVTAAFNRNVLSRINRELGGTFDVERFRHVALWNERASRVEMHLESTFAQTVRIEALDLTVAFAAGERIHTESSHKYDEATVTALFARAGLRRAKTFRDARGWFAVHLATAA